MLDCEAYIEHFADGKDPECGAVAQWCRGEALRRLGCLEESLAGLTAGYEGLVDAPVISSLAYYPARARALALTQLGDLDGALEWVDRALAATRAVEDNPMKQTIERALLLRLIIVNRRGHADECWAAAESAIDEIDPADNEEKRRVIVQALAMQGNVAQARGEYEVALAKFKLARTRREPSDGVTEPFCEALVGEAELLEIAEKATIRTRRDARYWRNPGVSRVARSVLLLVCVVCQDQVASRRS